MTTRNEICVLTDYRGAFYSTLRSSAGICSFDLDILRQAFDKLGTTATIRPYASIDFRKESFRDKVVVYQSAEGPDPLYKDYLEDLLLGIQLQGGVLVPSFRYFRSHHNKVFMEVLRDISADTLLQRRIESRYFGTFEDFAQRQFDYPQVFKKAWGAGSSGVRLATGVKEGRQIASKLSRSSVGLIETAREWYHRLSRKKQGYVAASLNRTKFVVQTFVPELAGDFKVLVYWDKYYVLGRRNRPGDFRASGSGLFVWPDEPPLQVLTYAKHVFDYFQVPVISLDIALSGDMPILIEFQCVDFGPLTMESSDRYFVQSGQNSWKKVEGKSTPEVEFARSVVRYIEATSTHASVR